ncbi:MAG TPA: LLM class flavin-dependent oxidoreductase [Stellaceae bacterium]|nr:LLM class flavin-dependent oxidoreductase [Stellaceae bacterium]
MEFGIQFFPDVGPEEKSAQDYWNESLYLAELGDRLGYGHVRTVEHYFHRYGGYSTNPIVFLAAAAQRTTKMRLITGAVLPVFNHPLKLAGEIGMLDAISNGRAEIGFARAFMPHEFQVFGRSMDESRARFNEGIEQIRRLLEEENVTSHGDFHSFENVTSLPRPTQKPRPPFWIATTASAESQIAAAKGGHSIMTVPIGGPQQARKVIDTYREAWAAEGRPGRGKVMIGLHMYCAPTQEEAERRAKPRVENYFTSLLDAHLKTKGPPSKDYPAANDKMIDSMRKATFEDRMKAGVVFIGSPANLREQIAGYDALCGGLDKISLQVNFHDMPVDEAEASIRLFAEEVMPHFNREKAST